MDNYERIRLRIFNVIKAVSHLPKTNISSENEYKNIYITHEHEFVPDFNLVWCDNKGHYRVYIYVASENTVKQKAGYNICNISNTLVAAGFVGLYHFLHRHRGNAKG